MAASYWTSSQHTRWLMPVVAESPGMQRDLQSISWTDRLKLTLHYTNVIQAVAKRMMLRQRVIATAMTYFQRFYANNGYADTDGYPIACTCLYLAAKVEETPHHLRTFVNETRECIKRMEGGEKSAATSTATPPAAGTSASPRFPYSSADIAELEIYLLEEMDFYMVTFLPYDLLTYLGEELQLPQALLQTAWFAVNDSFRLDACLCYPPHVIALAALYMTFVLQPVEATSVQGIHGTDVTPLTGTVQDRLKRWFAGISTPLVEIADVVQRLVLLYRVWDQFREADEVPAILLQLREDSTGSQSTSTNTPAVDTATPVVAEPSDAASTTNTEVATSIGTPTPDVEMMDVQ